MSTVVPGAIVPESAWDAGPPIEFPLTNTTEYEVDQLHVPALRNFQVFTNVESGAWSSPSGTVTSETNPALSHPPLAPPELVLVANEVLDTAGVNEGVEVAVAGCVFVALGVSSAFCVCCALTV
jgi:hypothetical protein